MTDKQENMFSMFVILYGFLSKFPDIVASIPAFKRAFEKLGALIEEIKEVDCGRESIKSGKSDLKSNRKNELASAIFIVASSLYTYADENNNLEILNRVDKTENYYKRMRDSNLILEAKELVKLTTGIETELLDQGLSAEEIAEAATLATEFENAMKEVGSSEAEGTAATKSVYELIGEAKDICDKQLNVHAAKFNKKNPEFYNQYLSASRIIDTGVRHEKKEEATSTETTTATS
jgi:hypothetical protein